MARILLVFVAPSVGPRLAVGALIMLRSLPALLVLLAACTAPVDGSTAPDSVGKADDATAEVSRDDVASVFLVEHFNVDVNASMEQALRDSPPGGVLFWNGNGADAQALREVIRHYSGVAQEAGHGPILFSADYEGGALSRAPSGRSIAGVQRFRSGLTALAHPSWLGVAFETNEELGLELAELHGEIMARELRSVGLNLPLSVIGDLAYRLFAVRGLDTDERIVAALLSAVTEGFLSQPDVVFNTKHFPGLGQTRGDTHDETVLSTVTNLADAERHLHPFRAYVEHTNATDEWPRATIMNGHAVFPLYDPDHNTTTSPAILKGLLRDDVGFRGLAISDAMWMGPYGELRGNELYRVYLTSFLAGNDLLMIPGGRFSGSRRYFEAVYDGTTAEAEQQRIVTEVGAESFEEVRQALLSRLSQSRGRLRATQDAIRPAAEAMDEAGVDPRASTAELSSRYRAILEQLPGWR